MFTMTARGSEYYKSGVDISMNQDETIYDTSGGVKGGVKAPMATPEIIEKKGISFL